MGETRLTNAALRRATMQVREAMLSSLKLENVAEHDFTEGFLAELRVERDCMERANSLRRQRFHRCVAAVLSAIVGLTLFFAINTEARATVLAWLRRTFEDRTDFSFFQDEKKDTVDYQLTWLPESVKFIAEERTSVVCMRLYQNVNNPEKGFVIQCRKMDHRGNLTMNHNGANYEIRPVEVNGMWGELYISDDPDVTSGIVWIDEGNQVVFTIDGSLSTDVILHIAENVKLVNPTK